MVSDSICRNQQRGRLRVENSLDLAPIQADYAGLEALNDDVRPGRILLEGVAWRRLPAVHQGFGVIGFQSLGEQVRPPADLDRIGMQLRSSVAASAVAGSIPGQDKA